MTPQYEAQMTALLTRLGADNAESLLSSEQRENIPQVAHFLFVHEVRKILAQLKLDAPDWDALPQQTTPFQIAREGVVAVSALKESGVSQEQLNAIYRLGVCHALFRMLGLIDGTYATEAENEPLAPGWQLLESTENVEGNRSTGRIIGGAHEYFEALYPND